MKEIHQLLKIMSDLRHPETGCPWDIKQSFASISPYTVEEAYEVADAIEREDMEDLKSELGDLLFQVVFHAQMASEQGLFDFLDVVVAISEKLVRRHPHVFGDEKVDNEKQLFENWEQSKKVERDNKSDADNGMLAGIATSLPALRWSEKIQKRASHHGFDWRDIEPVFEKVQEEIDELKAEVEKKDNIDRITVEMGDIFFASVNLSRHLGVDAEQALRESNRKFISRFEIVEKLLREDGLQMDACSVEALESYWQKAKEIISPQMR